MPKLKLGKIEDEKPVKLTIELAAATHRALIAYGELLGRETGQSTIEPKAYRPYARTFYGDQSCLRKTSSSGAQLRDGASAFHHA